MKPNSRLSLAFRALIQMSCNADRAVTSARLAHQTKTNPVVVRRVLGRLREAGIVASERGHSGGWWLVRDPTCVTLADVYVALEQRLVTAPPTAKIKMCSIERALQDRMSDIKTDIEASLIARLSDTTLADIQETARL